ncbi:hypothetical protein ACFOKI_06585 [Sphingomonas qilianensis]|uniref:Uncharacterized protein n=1 Tax=Sphingomonas qilianensis TaxID=1736690 RepID=A0ABU9XR26_9SPHN
MHVLMIALLIVWGLPLSLMIIAYLAALISPRARLFLRRHLIAD